MRQVVESDKITYLRDSFLRVLQQLTSGIQTVLRDELRKGHPLAPLEIGAERRTIHAVSKVVDGKQVRMVHLIFSLSIKITECLMTK